MILFRWSCRRCGHDWFSAPLPRCPHCKSGQRWLREERLRFTRESADWMTPQGVVPHGHRRDG